MFTVTYYTIKKSIQFLLLLFFILSADNLIAQSSSQEAEAVSRYIKGNQKDLYGTTRRFIENVGQYGENYPAYHEMGKILYAY
jgi:hypothetical protein